MKSESVGTIVLSERVSSHAAVGKRAEFQRSSAATHLYRLVRVEIVKSARSCQNITSKRWNKMKQGRIVVSIEALHLSIWYCFHRKRGRLTWIQTVAGVDILTKGEFLQLPKNCVMNFRTVFFSQQCDIWYCLIGSLPIVCGQSRLLGLRATPKHGANFEARILSADHRHRSARGARHHNRRTRITRWWALRTYRGSGRWMAQSVSRLHCQRRARICKIR